MTFVTPNAQDLSRGGRVHHPKSSSQPQILGTVVAHCQKRMDRGLKNWIQIQTSDGDLSWWPISRSDIPLGQFLRIDSETGEACNLPILLPDAALANLYRACPNPNDLDRLLWLIAGIDQWDLCVFMRDVLQDEAIALPLVQQAASCRHHHSEPGGLLSHTIECAEWVQMWASILPSSEADLTLVATLCHDIGKTITMTASQLTSDTGQMVTHEIMGLQILQPYLATLRERKPRLADGLLHMLSWRPSKQEPLPRLPGLVMLKHADQLSTVMDLRARAFEGYPTSYFWRKPNEHQAQRFHRID